MKLAFLKARQGRVLDKVIDLWTGGWGYSHVELIFSDGMSFSSSPREGKCRFKRIEYDPNKWIIIDIGTYENENAIRRFAESINGAEYDWSGIFFHQIIGKLIKLAGKVFYFVVPDCFRNKLQSKRRWWCSEICSFLIGDYPFRIDPNKMARKHNVPKVKRGD